MNSYLPGGLCKIPIGTGLDLGMCVLGNLRTPTYQEVYVKYQLELVWI